MNFPNNPTDGQLYPIAPTANQVQYKYNSSKQAWLANPAIAITPVIVVTSTSSNSISNGSKLFTISSEDPIGFFVGQRLRAAFNSNNYMEGVVTDLSSTQIVLNIDYVFGSGSYSSWVLGITGERGVQGPQGPSGAPGADGSSFSILQMSSTQLALDDAQSRPLGTFALVTGGTAGELGLYVVSYSVGSPTVRTWQQIAFNAT